MCSRNRAFQSRPGQPIKPANTGSNRKKSVKTRFKLGLKGVFYDSDASDVDTVKFNIIHTRAISVPEYIYADAGYSVPIRFRVLGGFTTSQFTPYIHSVTVNMHEKGMNGDLATTNRLMSYTTGSRFGRGDGFGLTQGNGESRDYTVFVPIDEFKSINLPNDSTKDAYFSVSATVELFPAAPLVTTANSVETVDHASPAVFADADIYVMDIPGGTNAQVTTIDLNAANQQTNLNSSTADYYLLEDRYRTYNPPKKLTDPSTQVLGFGGFDIIKNDTTRLGDGLKAETKLEDDFWQHDPPGSNFKRIMAVNRITRGGYFFVSYGPRQVSYLGNENAMDTGKLTTTYNMNWFNNGRVSIESEEDHGEITYSAASLGTGLGWAILPAFGPFGTVLGTIAGVANVGITAVGPSERISQAGGQFVGVLAHALPHTEKGFEQFTISPLQSSTSQIVFGASGKGMIVGEQASFYVAIDSWTINKPGNAFSSNQAATVVLDAGTSNDWNGVRVSLSPQ